MRQADAFHSTLNSKNLSRILHHALWLVELAGKEQDAARRDALITECMAAWRAAQQLAPMAEPSVEGLIMNMTMETLWPMWAIAAVFAFAFRHETVITLSGLLWWHRVLGAVAAVAFYGVHFGVLK
jgi:hypothetical protein